MFPYIELGKIERAGDYGEGELLVLYCYGSEGISRSKRFFEIWTTIKTCTGLAMNARITLN